MDRDEAPGVLVAVAEAAQDVAAGLNKFLSPVSDCTVDITALIAKCFAVSSALRGLATAVEETRRTSWYNRAAEEIEDVAKSLDHTFKDVHQIVGEGFSGAKKAKTNMNSAYRKVWKNINEHFRNESGNLLVKRLEYCRLLVIDLCDILREGSPRDHESFTDLAERVSALLEVQMARLRQGIDWLEPEAPMSPGPSKKQPSFERERPSTAETKPGSSSSKASSSKTASGKKLSTSKRHSSSSSNRKHKPPPPPAPEVPRSDSSSRDSRSNASVDMSESSFAHWLPKVFERSPPATKFSETGQPSTCLAEDNPSAIQWLEEEYVRLITLSFENGDLVLSLHLRSRDGRARLLCQTKRPSRHRKDCTIYLTSLDIEREGQFLKLCKVNSSGRRSGLWAVLRFACYETLVLFFSTFLALRAEDNGQPMLSMTDYKLNSEEEVFKCDILDDSFTHRLLVLRDRDTGGIRLQASVLSGNMKKKPVWTAFITHQVHSPLWMRKSGPKTVLLADLYRYIFDNEYTPPIASGGEHDITFKDLDDAEEFRDIIEDLAERALEEG